MSTTRLTRMTRFTHLTPLTRLTRSMLQSAAFPTMYPMSTTPPESIEKKIEVFLAQLGVPGFIVFGWKDADSDFKVVSSFKDIPPHAAIKGLSWALHDFVNKTL